MTPFFSIIMPCFLGDYKGAAKDRPTKLIRAIDSVLKQTETNYELIIIADGCEQTFNLVSEKYKDDLRVECYLIQKQHLWSGICRQFGIKKAKGTWITYLDSDDYFGEKHLEIIKKQCGEVEWVCFDDYIMDKAAKPAVRRCLIQQKYQCGTSNIAHLKSCKVMWGNGYGYDDYSAVQSLLKFHPYTYKKISTPEYFTCHVPVSQIDV